MKRTIPTEDIPKINKLIFDVLGTDKIANIDRMGGLTNHTYAVTLEDGKKFVVRIPGEGTEEMINRRDEMISTSLAARLGIDAEVLYFGKDGSKVTAYIENAVTMSSDTLKEEENISRVAQIFRTLHTCGEDTEVPFEVFDMADSYEKIIENKNVALFDDYIDVKAKVFKIKSEIDDSEEIKKVPCHNDALCENWVMGNGRMYLIDWEYAGMNDAMWDLADVSIEAGFDAELDAKLLEAYLSHTPSVNETKHFLAGKIYVDYLWTLWAKARVPYDGQSMEDWANERYARLKGFIRDYNNI